MACTFGSKKIVALFEHAIWRRLLYFIHAVSIDDRTVLMHVLINAVMYVLINDLMCVYMYVLMYVLIFV